MNLKCLFGKHTWAFAVPDLQPEREDMKTLFCVKCKRLEIFELDYLIKNFQLEEKRRKKKNDNSKKMFR